MPLIITNQEYKKFKKKQDESYISDFDQFIENAKLLEK